MYHLVRSLYLHYTSKEEYSILLLGLDNAGKTTLLNQIKAIYNVHETGALGASGEAPPSQTAGETIPTVGQNVATIDLPDMYLKIWDVGGQLSLRRLWTSYYKSCHAIVFVLDSTDLGVFEADEPSTPNWARRASSYRLQKTIDGEEPLTPITPGMVTSVPYAQGRLDEARAVLESVLESPDTAGVPVLVLANKQDREDCLEVVRIKEGLVRPVFEGEKGEMVRDSRVLPVSALNGTGVKECVEWLRSRTQWNKTGRPPVMR